MNNMKPTRERKELGVGQTESEAIADFPQYNEENHEMIYDPETKLWSIFHRRRKTDRTIKRPISRESREPYSNGYGKDRRSIIVTLHPRELIQTRLKGTRRTYQITWDDLHQYLVRRHALNAMRIKNQERAKRRAAAKAARRLARRAK